MIAPLCRSPAPRAIAAAIPRTTAVIAHGGALLQGRCAAFNRLLPGRRQNAGTTAPLYLSRMNCRTSGEVRAAASFFIAGLSTLSVRPTSRLA